MRQPDRATVAVARIDFRIPLSRGLKDKRSVVKSFLQKARDRYGLAACESGYLDDSGLASLTITAVSGDEQRARETLRSAVTFLEENYGVEVFQAIEEVF
jgi:uncharacterized protein